MLTLFKIRMTYMKRNFCTSFCSYLVFPIFFICYGPLLQYYMEETIKRQSKQSNNLNIFNNSIPNHRITFPITYKVEYGLFKDKLSKYW